MKVMNHKLYIRMINTSKYKQKQKNNRQPVTKSRELTLKEVCDQALNELEDIYNHYKHIHNTLTSNNIDSDLLINYKDFEETIDVFLDMYDEKN